jgi:hypothetical protein
LETVDVVLDESQDRVVDILYASLRDNVGKEHRVDEDDIFAGVRVKREVWRLKR